MKITLDVDALIIDGAIVIDARGKATETHAQGWVSKKAYKEMGECWRTIRQAYMSSENLEEALKRLVVEKFGVKPEEIEKIEITGGIPEHWKEEKEGKIKPLRRFR